MQFLTILLMCSAFVPLVLADGAIVMEYRVAIPPAHIEFALPKTWKLLRGETVHVSDRELKKVERAEGEWDREFSAVVNAALPFNHCMGHFGEEGWGDQSCSFADLQFRVYFVDATERLVEQLSERALGAARRFSEKALIEETSCGDWRIVTVGFPLWYVDYGGTAQVVFYGQPIGTKMIIFAFMRSDYPGKQDQDILSILASVKTDEGRPNQALVPTTTAATSAASPAR